MKRLHIIYTYACALALWGMVLWGVSSCGMGNTDNDNANKEAAVDTLPMMVRQIQQCSRLYTAEYKVHKIVTHDDVASLSGKVMGKDFSIGLPVGKRKVAIPVDATLKAYIDMSQIKDGDVRRMGDKIEVVLPKPHVVMTSTKVDHDGIKQYVALLRGNFSDEELSSYEKQGRKSIIADIPNMGILQMAKQGAANQLIPMITKMGFRQEDIIITFIESEDKKGGIAWILD